MIKRLHKNTEGQMICGVCSGLAEYFNADVTIIRLLTVISAITGVGTLVYIAAAIIMPNK